VIVNSSVLVAIVLREQGYAEVWQRQVAREPLLCLGDDFARTDLELVL
jgi:uncharacterized protein with PIN domain